MVFLILPLGTYNHTIAEGDIAEYLNNPLRVINGELPYRDFWLLFPPGEVFFPALIYKLFGLNINIVLIFSVIISAFVGVFSFLLGRSLFGDNFSATISATLVFFSGVTAHYLSYIYLHMYLLLLLISVILFVRYLKKNGITELFLAGIFMGLAFLFRFYEVGAAFLACLLTIFVHSKQDDLARKPLSYSLRSITIFGVGSFLVVSFVAFLALHEIWQVMLREIVTESLSSGTSLNLPYFYTLVSYLRFTITDVMEMIEIGTVFVIPKILYHLVHLIYYMLYYLLPFLLAGISVWYLAGTKSKQFDETVVFFFLLWGMFTFPKALGRSGISHLAPSVTPLFFILTFFLQKNVKKVEKNRSFLEKFTPLGFIVITTFLLSSVPLFVIETGYALTIPHYQVSTRYGTLLLSNESEAKDVNAVINFVNRNTEEGDYIFVTPWFDPPFYILTNRKNPTYYDSLIDLVARPSDEKQMKIGSDLLDRDTRLIIHYANWGFDSKEELHFLNACHVLQKYIEDNFELAKRYGHYWIYVPKNS